MTYAPRKEIFWVILCCIILNFFSYIRTFQTFSRAPSDRYYWGDPSEYPIDAIGNLYTIRQGYLGHWWRQPQETSLLNGIPTLIKSEYILIGQIGRLIHIDPVPMYFASKFFISTMTLIGIYLFIRSIFKTSRDRIISYILALFATSVILPIPWSTQILSSLHGDVYVFFRLTIAAHHYILGTFLTLASLYFLAQAIDHRRFFLSTVFAIIPGMIGVLVYAPAIVMIILSLPLFACIYIFRHRNKKAITNMVAVLFYYVGMISIPFLYLHFMEQFWDYSVLKVTEGMVSFSSLPWQYIITVGIPYLFALISVPYVLKKGNTLMLILIPWLIVHPFATYVLTSWLHINTIRFFYSAYFVIFAILGTQGMILLADALTHAFPKFNKTTVMVFFTVIVLLSGTYTYICNMDALRITFWLGDQSSFGYPKKEFMRAVDWLKNNTSENDIVLSDFYSGMLIPAFAGNKVYTSWWFRLNGGNLFNVTYANTQSFYGEAMGDSEAHSFLKTNHISYVFLHNQSPDEQPLPNGLTLSYSFLREKFRTTEAVIYAVQ